MQEYGFIKNLQKTYVIHSAVTLDLHFPYCWIVTVTLLLCVTFPFIDFILCDC